MQLWKKLKVNAFQSAMSSETVDSASDDQQLLPEGRRKLSSLLALVEKAELMKAPGQETLPAWKALYVEGYVYSIQINNYT